MIKKLIIILLLWSSQATATTVETYQLYNTNDTVTSINLNGNFNNIRNVINGDIDNDNINTSGGYWLVQVLNSLPAAGNQGRVVFLTSDNSLYFDTGSTFITVPSYSGTAALGDTLYGNGTNWSRLSKDTNATRYLSNRGSSNVPSWTVINLTNGVENQLALANGGTGSNLADPNADRIPFWDDSLGAVTWLNAIGVKNTTLQNVEIFTSSSTFVAPAGVSKVYLTMVGAGGGGGTSAGTANGGGGGGGGASLINFPFSVTGGNSYTVTVGAGGAETVAGGTTSFDSVSVTGGAGGTVDGALGGSSVSGVDYPFDSSASVTTARQTGGLGVFRGGNGGDYNVEGGGGGGTPFGAGATGGAADGAGSSATANTGAGGGGAGPGGSDVAGGSGGSGLVIVMY